MADSDMFRRGLLSRIGTVGVGALAVGTGTADAGRNGRRIVGTRTRGAADAARRRADSVHRVFDFGGVGQAVAGRFSEEAVENLRRNPNVRYVEDDGLMHAVAVDAGGEVPWGVDRVDAERAHADGFTGAGADVAIVDTGIDSDHPDLEANLGVGAAFVEAEGSYAEAWDDDNGHGTHCAGIAGAVGDGEGVVGVSTEATLHAVKVLAGDGSGAYSDVAAGIQWVADRGYDVASMSLGGPKSKTIEDACRYAYDRGVFLVAAAGNDGGDVEDAAPATYATVVAVSATDRDDSLAGFSNTGGDVELAAPGVNVSSTYPGGGYETLSGTSMACPHVGGAAGQLMARGFGRAEARARLAETAEDVGLSSDEQGNGLLDVEAAVSGTADATPTVSWSNPTDGDAVSGTVAVRIDAADAEDGDGTLSVTYGVDGGTARSAAYDAASGYYEDSWDATAVPDGDHTLTAEATDSAGNAVGSSVTVSTDNGEGGASTPTVDALAIAENDRGGNPHADFDVSWAVSDGGGDLARVSFTLTDLDTGETEDAVAVDVAGGSASGTTELVAKHDENGGREYEVEAVVTDGGGGAASATATEVEDGR